MTNTGRTHRGKLLPINRSIESALQGIRAQHGRHGRKDQGDPLKSAKEMASLGKLLFAWDSLVGVDLARFTYPGRLVRGTLTVLCADSSWLHTFQFVRPQLMKRITESFPFLRITNIVGRLGPIPRVTAERSVKAWPAWEEQTAPELPATDDEELRERIRRCQLKLKARQKGLTGEGLELCPECGRTLVRRGEPKCALCVFHRQQETVFVLRRRVLATPWISFEELQAEIPELRRVELQRVKNTLANECELEIRDLFGKWQDDPLPKLQGEIRRAMILVIVLVTGQTPDQVSLWRPMAAFPLPAEWVTMLEAFRTRKASC